MSTIFNAQGTRRAKVFIGVGHGDTDPGATGYIREADVNLNMALAEKDYLVANNVEVCMSRIRDENDDIREEIRECNAYGPALAHDCHNNSGGGDGFEVYCSIKGGESRILAQNINEEVIGIGQNSRGVKTRVNSSGRDYYGFIRQTNAPAVITEGVFVDNEDDASQADSLAEQREFGYAYARGILKTLGLRDNGLEGGGSSGINYTKLTIDGYFGPKTVRASQMVFGTYADSVISKQPLTVKRYLPNAVSSAWEFKRSGYNGGSSYILATQRFFNEKGFYNGAFDGWAGPQYVAAMQRFLASISLYSGRIDRIMGENTVKGWQRYINSRSN